MLKETAFECVLHGEYPRTFNELCERPHGFLHGLDFVVEEWLAGMQGFPNIIDMDVCRQQASQVLMSVVGCRFTITDFLTNKESQTSFMDVMKAIKDLKQCFVILAKPYLNISPLANWYLDLPLKVQHSFKNIHMGEIARRREYDGALMK